MGAAAGLDGDSVLSLGLRVTDPQGFSGGAAATVNVANVSPSIGAVSGPIDPLQVGSVVGDLELLVRPPARLRGRVLDPQGQPLAGVVINVRGGNSPVRRRATSAADGTFVIGPLYDGDYELRAQEGPLALLARKWEVADARVDRAAKEAAAGAANLRDPAKRGAAIDALEQQMKEAAANLEFEVAAMLRDQVIELRALDGPNLDRGTSRDRQRA